MCWLESTIDVNTFFFILERTYVCSELSPALPWTCNWVVEPLVIVSSYLDSNYSFLKIFDSFPSLTSVQTSENFFLGGVQEEKIYDV